MSLKFVAIRRSLFPVREVGEAFTGLEEIPMQCRVIVWLLFGLLAVLLGLLPAWATSAGQATLEPVRGQGC
jgi:hypothetical protein